jgi:hypothetical protein
LASDKIAVWRASSDKLWEEECRGFFAAFIVIGRHVPTPHFSNIFTVIASGGDIISENQNSS